MRTHIHYDIQWGLHSKPLGGEGGFQPCANGYLG